MRINNKEIKDFSAYVVSFDMNTLGIENNIMLLESSYLPVLREQKLSAQERVLIIDFINQDDISDFTVECCRESILDIDDGYEYVCYLKASPTIQTDGLQAYTVSYPMYVIKRKPMILEILGESVYVQGNVKTNCIYEITSQQDTEVFSIDSYLVKNLKANEALVIDGINKLIYRSSQPDLSAFDDVELISFPNLEPGIHHFIKSDETVQVILKYYPTYM